MSIAHQKENRMITYEELHQQNHAITEISNVLLYLIEERSMCDTQITCDLFFDYVDKVKNHLEIQDLHMYNILLTKGDSESKKVADNFMSGSKEIKRIFQSYQKKWSNKQNHALRISNYDQFKKETREMFDLVLKRIQDETERLFPLVKEVSGDYQQVA